MSKKQKGGTPQKVKNQGLVMMNFQVPQEKYLRFTASVKRRGLTIRAVAEAFLDYYLKGGFVLEEEQKKIGTEKG